MASDSTGPDFSKSELLPAIAQDAESGDVLMMAWMNADALAATLETRRATYWSRSRGELWVKGETSGHVQEVVEVRIDCDQDAVLLKAVGADKVADEAMALIDRVRAAVGGGPGPAAAAVAVARRGIWPPWD